MKRSVGESVDELLRYECSDDKCRNGRSECDARREELPELVTK